MVFGKRTFKRQDQLGLSDIIQDSVRSRSTANLKKFAQEYKFRRKMEKYAKIFGGALSGVILLFSVISYVYQPVVDPNANQVIDAIDRNIFLRINRIDNWNTGGFNRLQAINDDNYQVVLPLNPGEYELKIADQGWTFPYIFGFNQPGLNLNLNEDVNLSNNEGNQNIKLSITTVGAYQFTFTANLPDIFLLNCKKLDI